MDPERVNPLITNGPVPGPRKVYQVWGIFLPRGDPWTIQIPVILGSLHPKVPPKLIWAQNSS